MFDLLLLKPLEFIQLSLLIKLVILLNKRVPLCETKPYFSFFSIASGWTEPVSDCFVYLVLSMVLIGTSFRVIRPRGFGITGENLH